MTHDEWENGGRLIIHNATKEQLKFMVKDRDSVISRMYKELEEKDKVIDGLCAMIHKLTEGETMKRTLDIWPGNSYEDIAKIDIFFSDCDCVYRGNIYNKDGKMIGDYSASDSLTLEKMFPQLVFNWD